MDSRPFRPRGAENALPQLHQRHKSTGNIAAMASASQGGFRNPAKRAAFGDVTNLTKNVGNGWDNGKVVKLQASSLGLQASSINVNKENAPTSHELPPLPVQRSAGLAQKPNASAAAVRLVEPDARATRGVFDGLMPLRDADVEISQLPVVEEYSPNVSLLTQQEALPPQPRHYKSQPQLKQQQPVLRRTQSRQLESTAAPTGRAIASAATSIHSSMAAQSHIRHEDASSLDFLYLPTDSYGRIDNAEMDYAQAVSKLPGISEEIALVPVSLKDGSAPALPEPEECWEHEDEDDYEDQDQAYTTAHSFRSRDMTNGGATIVLAPRFTTKVHRELEDAKSEVVLTRQDDMEEEMWDVSMVAEYGEEIFEYMRELEIKMLPNPHYMDIQTEIEWSMRSVLMDWLVQVHSRFGLLPETLFLTVNYIDRFLSSKIVSIGKLQLVGATAILVASKYEEINCPSLQEIEYMVDKGYTAEEILKAERFMLSMLGFELGWPGPMSFLRRVSKADDYDLETRTLAKYFLELTIMDKRFVASPPSFLAAGAHCLSRLILNKGDWTKAHVHFSGYTWSQLRALVTLMIECCLDPTKHHYAVYEKYREKRFKEASLIVQDALDAGFTLPHFTEPVRWSHTTSAPLEDTTENLFQSGLLVSIEG